MAAAFELEYRSRTRVVITKRGDRSRLADFDHPEIPGQPGGEVQLESPSVAGCCRESCLQGPARVDDQEVAGHEPLRQISESGMGDQAGVDPRDEQAYAITRQASRLRRLARLQMRRQRGRVSHACCSHRASSCCAANRSPRMTAGS